MPSTYKVDVSLANEMGAFVEKALPPEEMQQESKSPSVRRQRDRTSSVEDMGAFVEGALSEDEARSSRAVKPKKSGTTPEIER